MFFEKRKIQENKKENTISLVQLKKTTITVRKKKRRRDSRKNNNDQDKREGNGKRKLELNIHQISFALDITKYIQLGLIGRIDK